MRNCLGLLLLLAPTLSAAELDKAKLAAVGPAMQRFVDDGTVAGVVAVVGSSRGVARIDAVGQLTLDPPTPMPKDALFRIASMTKPMTAVGVMILADEGKLSPDDPVEKHLPEFKGQMVAAARGDDFLVLRKPKRPATLRDLMTHTAGLSEYPESLQVYSKRDRSLAETILAVSQRPLLFEPGSRWSYCNPGIDALGRVIEVASGESYESFMRKRIFEPLGMKDTTFTPTKQQLARSAGLYGQKGGKLVDAGYALLGPTAKSKHPIPAGGLYSTGADVARLYQMMLNGGSLEGKAVLSKKGVAEMTRIQTGDLKTGFTDGMGFGYGFAVVRKPEGVTGALSAGSFGHGGAFGTQSWADPKQDLLVVLLIQRVGMGNADGSKLRGELQRIAAEAVAK